jgi:hypothetical protein
MRNLDNLIKFVAAVLLAAVWTSDARAGSAGATTRALVADWKEGDREMAAVAEVIASAFASGMSWAGTIEGHPLYCPPPIGAFTDKQAMSIPESFIADHPKTADKTYGLALSASLRQATSSWADAISASPSNCQAIGHFRRGMR